MAFRTPLGRSASILRRSRRCANIARASRMSVSKRVSYGKEAITRFAMNSGFRTNPQRFTQLLAVKAKAAGLPVVKIHALRHGHASAGIAAGVDVKVMSDRLGHSSYSITADVYSHISATIDQAAAATVAAVIDGQSPRFGNSIR